MPYWDDIPRFEIGDWWKDEDLPLDLKAVGEFSSVSCEIGFGHGEFLLAMAGENKDGLFVGVERYGDGMRKMVRAVRSLPAENILPLSGDGYVILQVAFGDESLDRVFVNFPDPWPKKRHEKRRLFTTEFFSLCARKLKPGGTLNLATDVRELAEQAQRELSGMTELGNDRAPEPYARVSPHPYRTRYERKWMAEGRELYYFTYGKR